MPYLGDYVGHLLSEISMARMQADLETVRMAELYAAHPLLRTMPVPRMRLPEVDLEIPVLIEASEEPRAGESARGGASLPDLRLKFDEVVAAHLSKAGLAPTAEEGAKLGAALDERLARHEVPAEVSIDVNRVADDLTSTALRVLGDLRSGRAAAELAIPATVAAELKDAVRLEFLKLRTAPPRLTVLVTSAAIREAGDAQNLTRLRLRVSEQSVEWTSVESDDGSRRDFLVPE